MPVTLTRPTEGSVGWAGAVNQNFQDIETALNTAGAFLDTIFRVQNGADPTKQVAIDLSGVTTATTRTLTVPNASGTIALTSQLPTGAALTKTDDTNVTLTLGGSPSTSLLNAASLTLGWTGQLAATRGGTGQSGYAIGDLLYANTTTSLNRLAPSTTGRVLTTKGTGSAPTWEPPTGGTTFDELDLTTSTTTLTTADEGKVVCNEGYSSGVAQADLPTLGTASTDAVLFGAADDGQTGGCTLRFNPGASGYMLVPGAMDPAASDDLTTMDISSSALWWGKRNSANSADLWWPFSMTGRHVLAGQSTVFGNVPGVNPFHNHGYVIATASGTLTRYGDMNALTITDPAGSTDGQDNSHGYYVAAGVAFGLATASITENTTCPARFGGSHQFYLKFSAGGLSTNPPLSASSYGIGWVGTGGSVGLRLERTPAGVSNTYFEYRGSTTLNSVNLGFGLTNDAVYQLMADVSYTSGGSVRVLIQLFDATGARLYFNSATASTANAPGPSVEARLSVSVGNSGGDSSARNVRLFHASRWARRAPG